MNHAIYIPMDGPCNELSYHRVSQITTTRRSDRSKKTLCFELSQKEIERLLLLVTNWQLAQNKTWRWRERLPRCRWYSCSSWRSWPPLVRQGRWARGFRPGGPSPTTVSRSSLGKCTSSSWEPGPRAAPTAQMVDAHGAHDRWKILDFRKMKKSTLDNLGAWRRAWPSLSFRERERGG